MNVAQNASPIDPHAREMSAYARGLYIDGKWRQAANGRLIDVVDPSSETVLAAVPDATIEDAGARRGSCRQGRAKGWRRGRRRASAPKFSGAASS